jgi:flagellin
MSIYMNANTTSLNAQRNLGNTQLALSQNMQQLSSGMRINTAADDPAGLAISQKMQSQIVSTQQDTRNANDAISMIQVAQGAMNQTAGILNQLRQLAVQSANGTMSSTDRSFIDTTANQLLQEVDRIANSTDFNGQKMLGADSGTVSMQVGLDAVAGTDTIDVNFSKTDSTSLGVKYGAGNDVDLGTSAATAQTALGKIDAAITALSTAQSNLGASQSRLQVTVSNLSVQNENLTAANARIRDVDVAQATADMTQNQILSQAGVAVLAQANQIPSAALKLLGA